MNQAEPDPNRPNPARPYCFLTANISKTKKYKKKYEEIHTFIQGLLLLVEVVRLRTDLNGVQE